MAAPARIDARLPHKASCANQFNICDTNCAPGIPADVGDTDTCPNHNVTFTANLLVAERTGAQVNGSRRAHSDLARERHAGPPIREDQQADWTDAASQLVID